MKRRTILFITVLFGAMLIGIVVMQAGWVMRVMELNQKAFDDAVYKSLAAVVKEVEEKENYAFIKRQVETDARLQKTRKFLKERAQAKRHRTRIISGESNLHITMASSGEGNARTVVRIEKEENGKRFVQKKVVIGAAAADSGGPVSSFEFITSDDKKENVELILEKMLSIRDPDSVMIKPAEIRKMLATQLRQNNLPSRFAFALLSKDPKKSYVSAAASRSWMPYPVSLYPNDLYGREVTLALLLPPDKAHVRFDMWGAMGLSLVFTAVLLILFVYSIRMLLRHKKMLSMKNDFINHMSHEFKTPLAGISLGADMLIGKTGQMSVEDIRKVATTIKKQSSRLSEDVSEVLQHALLEEEVKKPHELFNLADAVRRQLDLFQTHIDAKSAHVICNLSADPVLVRGNEAQWNKVVSNLLDNALKFSYENAEITIVLRAQGKKIILQISDNGAGISPGDLPRIFDKFFRSDYYRKSNIGGFGLGLSFVKAVVDAHGGAICAESELNAGTRIIIELDAER